MSVADPNACPDGSEESGERRYGFEHIGRRRLLTVAVAGLMPSLASCAGEGRRSPNVEKHVDRRVPSVNHTESLRLMSFNIRWGARSDGVVDLASVADVINAESPDVVALQEVDRGVGRSGGVDEPSILGHLTGLVPVFGGIVSWDGGVYGNAFLCRVEPPSFRVHRFRQVLPGEPRGLLEIELPVGESAQVRVFATHLRPGPDSSERLVHVAELLSVVGVGEEPVVVCGDFNDVPGSETYRAINCCLRDAWDIAGEGDGFTHPAHAPRRRIDYVFVGSGVRTSSARTTSPGPSDHRGVVAEVEVV